ncbi:hypothetical protein HY417_01430 [Candidatus Kaiserbacteria bacterium]|nr:hypothetical protein [Candidatus Kaiserbacteria bacterium]
MREKRKEKREKGRARCCGASRGLTGLETLIWVGVFSVVLGTIVSATLYFYRVNRYTLGQATSITSGQRGLDEMMRTIREAAYASDGAYPIISIATSSFSFYADTDTGPQIEKLRYFLQGTTLYEGIVQASGDPPVYTGAEATSSVSENVRNITFATSTFRYFDSNGVLMTDYTQIDDVRFVTVNLIIDTDTTQLPPEITLRSSAGMRNLVGY